MGLHQRTSLPERIIASLSYHLFIFLMRIAWQSTMCWVTTLPREGLCLYSDWIWICSLLLGIIVLYRLLNEKWSLPQLSFKSFAIFFYFFFPKLKDGARHRLLSCCCGLFVFISHHRALGSMSLLSISAAVQRQSYCTIQYLNNCPRWLLKSTAAP